MEDVAQEKWDFLLKSSVNRTQISKTLTSASVALTINRYTCEQSIIKIVESKIFWKRNGFAVRMRSKQRKNINQVVNIT